MSRQVFNEGQELIMEDLNSISERLEKQFYDDVITRMLGNISNAFFANSLRVSRINDVTILINEGFGLERTTSTTGPTIRPVKLAAPMQLTVEAADPQDRIDSVYARTVRINEIEATRRFKELGSDEIQDRNLLLATAWSSVIEITKGAPSANPVPPPAPAGGVKIADLNIARIGTATGSGVASVVDTRVLFPTPLISAITGTLAFDSIVGETLGLGISHTNVADAIVDVNPGGRILVLRSTIIDTPIEVNKNDLLIEFRNGISVTKGNFGAVSAVGINITANNTRIISPRLVDFDGAGDVGIRVDSSALRTSIEYARFNNVTRAIQDNSEEAFINTQFME